MMRTSKSVQLRAYVTRGTRSNPSRAKAILHCRNKEGQCSREEDRGDCSSRWRREEQLCRLQDREKWGKCVDCSSAVALVSLYKSSLGLGFEILIQRVPAVPVPDNLHSNGDPKERQQQQEQR